MTSHTPAAEYDPGEDGRRCYDLAIATKRAELLKSRGGRPLTVELPWPARELHPNARVHWTAKAKATKTARETAGWAAMAAGVRGISADRLKVTAVFHPPNARRRDQDGMLSSIKAYLDGIADICGVDDSRWDIGIRVEPPVKNGAVHVEIDEKILQPTGGQR